jgi:hypothetical protein
MDHEEPQTVLFTVASDTVSTALRQVSSCESCNPDAEFPFECILDYVLGLSGIQADYFMIQLGYCPSCHAAVSEKTLVEWNVGSSAGKA